MNCNNRRREGFCPYCLRQTNLILKQQLRECPHCRKSINSSMLLSVEALRQKYLDLEARVNAYRVAIKDLFPCFGCHDCNDYHRSKCPLERFCKKEKGA